MHSNKMTTIMALISLLAVSAPAVRGDQLTYSFEMPEPQVWQDSEGFSHVSMKGAASLAQPGKPSLPGRMVKIAVPPGHRVTSIEVFSSGMVELPGEHVIFPAQRYWPLSHDGPKPFTPPDPGCYESDSAWPAETATVSDPQVVRGFSVQPVLLRPVVYRPASGRLYYHPAITLSLTTRESRAADLSCYRGYARDFARVAGLVDNPELLGRYPAVQERDSEDTYRYVIVTNQAMASCSGSYTLQTLTADKESRGISTLIETMENIRSQYSGQDDAEKVRNFIKDKYQNNGCDFVLIAGDADHSVVGGETQVPLVPVRGMYVDTGYGYLDENIPSDLYYACLDGDFNSDGDSRWGEENDGVDYLSEVWVGRAPVDNCTEVSNFVRKTLNYQSAAGTWLENVYMVGEWLFEDGPTFGKDFLIDVQNSSSADGFSTKGFSESTFFQVSTLYEKDMVGSSCDGENTPCWGMSDIIPILNGGNHIINHLGHSYTYYNMRLWTDDLSNLNNDRFFFEYTQGCYAGSFDNRLDDQMGQDTYYQDSFAEHMTLDNRGAVAAVMNTRYGWGGASNWFHRTFWDAAFGPGLTRMGEMLAYSREQLSGWTSVEPVVRWVYYEATLFGDPELSIHTSASAVDPYIGLPEEDIFFLVIDGRGNPEDQTITVVNQGGGILNWSATVDQSWLTISPDSGTAPTDVVLSVDASGMGLGSYLAEITFTAPGAVNSPRVLPVALHVINVPSAVAPFVASSPSVDGVIGSSEYTGAAVLDMKPSSPGTSTARIMHDGSKLYFALSIEADPDADDYDAVLLLLDNDNDDHWPTWPGDEGLWEMYPGGFKRFVPAFNSGNGIEYGPDETNPAGLQSAFGNGASPRVVEYSLDLSQSHLTAGPGDSFGMFLFFYDFLEAQEDFEAVAFWPWAINTYDSCIYFGDVVVGTDTELLTASPGSLTFSAIQNGTPTPAQTLTIGTTTATSASFTLNPSHSWLHLSATSGVTPKVINVWANPAGETVGIKNGHIRVSAPGVENSPFDVPVTFEVSPAPPVFELNPGSLTFNADKNGVIPDGQTVQITNAGGGTLDWTLAVVGNWFDLSASSGTAPSSLTIRPNTTNLPGGFHGGAILLNAPGAEQARIELSYNIEIPPSLVVEPAFIDSTNSMAGSPVKVQLLISNAQIGAMEWNITTDSPWISVSPSSGTAVAGHASPVTVTLDNQGLSEGLHQGSLTVTAPGAVGSPAVVPVSYTLENTPAIAVSPTSLSFVATLGGANPDPQTLHVSNAGPGMMHWTVYCPQSWLSCDPVSGTNTGLVTVSVDISGLQLGVLTGSVMLASLEAANSPVEVNVMLEISEEPQNRPPPAPEQVSPPDLAIIDMNRPELIVRSVQDPDGDAVTYTFELYEKGINTAVLTLDEVPEGDGGLTVASMPTSLADKVVYQWRARAVDSLGAAGEWSEKWEFAVDTGGGNGGCGCATSNTGESVSVLLLVFLAGLLVIRLRGEPGQKE